MSSFIQEIIDLLLHEIKRALRGYANRILIKVVKLLILSVVGVSFLAIGLIFVLIGIVTYLSELMFPGLAWGIVGLIAALIGAILLLLLRR